MSGYDVATQRGAYAFMWLLVALQFAWGAVCLLWLGEAAGWLLLAVNWVWGAWNASRILDLHDYMWHGRL